MMLTSAWPYLLRIALGAYFLFQHLPPFLRGLDYARNPMKLDAIFSCASSFVAPEIAFIIWHALFIALAILIIVWKRPIIWIGIALCLLFIELYFDFVDNVYDLHSLLIIISSLVAIALLIIYGTRRRA